MKNFGRLLAAVVALSCLVGWTVFGQKRSSPKARWEYRVIGHGSETGEKELNDLGAQGWELAGVANDGHRLYLKRAR